MPTDKNTFRKLLSYFPEIELPVTLTSETHHIFSKENKPLPEVLIRSYLKGSDGDLGEFEEYIACFQLPRAESFVGLVYWKADLMKYQYVLVTFDQHGQQVASQIIAGTKSNGETILKRVATFDAEGVIYIAEGVGQADERHYQAGNSRNYQLEILPSGDILHMMNDN